MSSLAVASIVDFRPEHASAWEDLNLAWLAEAGFELEPKDRVALSLPEETFLATGGRIFIAEMEGQAVGCCALAPIPRGFELCKMTVSAAARGQGLALRLLRACEAAARDLGAQRLYLETNSKLERARKLYADFGFQDLPAGETPYARADVFMEKRLTPRVTVAKGAQAAPIDAA